MINAVQKEEISISTEDFLHKIHGKDALVYFNVAKQTWCNKPQTYLQAKWKLQRDNQNKDICFIVNSGGSKDIQITRINACFLDWDCGSDSEGKYFPLDIVAEKKSEFLASHDSFPLSPSYIVETRNGYHVYWLSCPGTKNDEFTDMQKRIAYYFKGDPSITNPARVMRLPGYDWVKPGKNCPRFPVRIVRYTPVRYIFSQLKNAFPSVSEEEFNSYKGQNKKKGRISAHNNNYGYYKDNTWSIYVGTKPEQGITVDTLEQAIEYVKRINPAKYFGFEPSEKSMVLSCPFHSDRTPSASLYQHQGVYYLKCHSSECQYGPKTIIDIIRDKEDCTTSEAIFTAMKLFNIELDKGWKSEQENILKQNITTIENIGDYQEQYPSLYSCIHRIQADLISKIEYAKEHVALKSCDNQFMFICSLRKFQELATNGLCVKDDVGRQNERVDRYCLLGLMRKLPDKEIPCNLLENAYEQREAIQNTCSPNGKVNTPRTQFYSIPEYTPELFKEADAIAKKLKEAGARMNSISYDLIRDVFGEDKAREVYPQINRKEMSSGGKKISGKVESILLRDLEQKGYSQVCHIVAEMQKEYDWKTVTDRRVKKYVPGLLRKHNLMEITANGQLKEKYTINSAGFPKIIIHQQ